VRIPDKYSCQFRGRAAPTGALLAVAVRISVFGQGTLVFSSARSEIIVGQPDPTDNELRRKRHVPSNRNADAASTRLCFSWAMVIYEEVAPTALLKSERRTQSRICKNQDCLPGIVCYSVCSFGWCSPGRQRPQFRPQVGSGGHRNSKINPVFRGMVRSALRRELLTKGI
jgi:hypothetical protein